MKDKKRMELEIIQHSDTSREDLLRIIDLKNAAWPHSIEIQLKWIEKNQHPEDIHVILRDNVMDIAYMDLCPVTAMVDGVTMPFMGVGNVCTKTHGLGHGGELMKLVNDYLVTNNFKGLLFCRDQVMRFYANYGWRVIPGESIHLEGEGHEGVYTMCYNTPAFTTMSYSDRDF